MMQNKIATLEKQKEIMIAYLNLKLDEEDWHGVQDAASDLRDIESEVKVWEEAIIMSIPNVLIKSGSGWTPGPV